MILFLIYENLLKKYCLNVIIMSRKIASGYISSGTVNHKIVYRLASIQYRLALNVRRLAPNQITIGHDLIHIGLDSIKQIDLDKKTGWP